MRGCLLRLELCPAGLDRWMNIEHIAFANKYLVQILRAVSLPVHFIRRLARHHETNCGVGNFVAVHVSEIGGDVAINGRHIGHGLENRRHKIAERECLSLNDQ